MSVFQRLWPGLAFMFAICGQAGATPFDVGDLEDFAVLSLGADFTLNGENRTDIIGNVGISNLNLAGDPALPVSFTFQKGSISGNLFLESGISEDISDKDAILNGTKATDADLQAARNAAGSLVDFAVQHSPGTELGSLNDSSLTVALNEGLNVVTFDEILLKEDVLTFDATGVSDASVLVNILGDFKIANSMLNLLGLDGSEVLFYARGGGTVEMQKDGSVWEGILLAPDRDNILIHDDGAVWNGQLIGGAAGGQFKIYSGADLTHSVNVPEPPLGLLLGLGCLVLLTTRRRPLSCVL